MHGAAARLWKNPDIASRDILGPPAYLLPLRGWWYSTRSINILAMQAWLCVSFSPGSPSISWFAAAQGVRPVPNKSPLSSAHEPTKARNSFRLYRMGEAALERPLQSGDQRRGACSAGGSGREHCRPGDFRPRRLWLRAVAAKALGEIRRAGGIDRPRAGHLDGQPSGDGRLAGAGR